MKKLGVLCLFVAHSALAAPPAVSSISVVDAVSKSSLSGYSALKSGTYTLDLSKISSRKWNFKANMASGTVRYVCFKFDSTKHTEGSSPYYAFGDPPNSWAPAVGTHTLSVSANDRSDCAGTAGPGLTLTLKVTSGTTTTTTNTSGVAPITNLALVNATNSSVISGYSSMNGGTVSVDLSKLPTSKLNIKATQGSGSFAAICFKIDGALHVERSGPYYSAGDPPAYWTPSVGNHSVSVFANSSTACTGTSGSAINLTLAVTKSSTVVEPPPPTSTTGSDIPLPSTGRYYDYYRAHYAESSAMRCPQVAPSAVYVPSNPEASGWVTVGDGKSGGTKSCDTLAAAGNLEDEFDAALSEIASTGGKLAFRCASSITVPITKEKLITKDTVIDGGGKVTLDAGHRTRIFKVAHPSGVSVAFTIQNISLNNGGKSQSSQTSSDKSIYAGGAIYHKGDYNNLKDLLVVNVKFNSNYGAWVHQDLGGGAIYQINGKMKIVNSTFTNNRGSNGGAIAGLNSDLRIWNSTFDSNQATGHDGNLDPDPNYPNQGFGGCGGAIYRDGAKDKSQFIMCSSRVTNNKGGNNSFGGGIFVRPYKSNQEIVMISNLIQNNSIRADNVPSGARLFGHAGGIWALGAMMTLANNQIKNNSAPLFAGAYLHPTDSFKAVIVKNSVSDNQSTRFNLGGLHIQNAAESLFYQNAFSYSSSTYGSQLKYETSAHFVDKGQNTFYPAK